MNEKARAPSGGCYMLDANVLKLIIQTKYMHQS